MRITLPATLALMAATTGCPLRPQTPINYSHDQLVAFLAAGDAALAQSRFVDARLAFERALLREGTLTPPERARAYFGHGVAVQEIWRGADTVAADSSAGATPDSASTPEWSLAIDSYRAAAKFDSARYFRTATYNQGVLYRQLGRHADAADEFVRLAKIAPDSERPRLLLWALQELQAGSPAERVQSEALSRSVAKALLQLQRFDTAARAVRLALARDPAFIGVDSTVAWLTRAVRDSTSAPAAADAAIAALRALGSSGTARAADSLLHLVALANITARTSPDVFADEQRDALGEVARTNPRLAVAIDEMRRAYAGERVVDLARLAQLRTSWWTRDFERRRTWSSLLRVNGQWNERLGADSLARVYYEGALSDPTEIEPWADLDAVLPLLLMYDRAADSSAANARRLDDFINVVFFGKSLAYQRGEVWRIRQFHTVLGNYYARHDRWQGAPRGAIFQLEHKRQVTAMLGGPTRGYVDPPELLEQLIRGYVATGDTAAARRVLPDLEAASRAVGVPGPAERWRARLNSAAPPP